MKKFAKIALGALLLTGAATAVARARRMRACGRHRRRRPGYYGGYYGPAYRPPIPATLTAAGMIPTLRLLRAGLLCALLWRLLRAQLLRYRRRLAAVRGDGGGFMAAAAYGGGGFHGGGHHR